jgi:peptidoglycan/LPS O-acetylase OafA/YrhL
MRIKGLDGLRAVAFLLVFIFHVHWVQVGWVGVQLFFVLSGFLITGILMDMKTRLRGASYFIKFYGRRFLRIFPLYYFYLLVMSLAVAWMAANQFQPKEMKFFHDQFPYAITYIYNLVAASAQFQRHSNFLTHLWSLAVEEQFYIIWPLLILLVPCTRYKRAFLSVIGLSILFRLWVASWNPATMPAFFIPDPIKVIYVMPFSHLDAFALGALLTVTDIPKARGQFIVLLVGLPVVGILTERLALGQWDFSSSFGFFFLLRDAYKSIWGYTALNYLFAVLIFGVARQGWFEHILESRPFVYLGKISYGLYVYHFTVLWFVTVPFNISNEAPFSLMNAIAALFLTVGIASLSYYLLEKPLMDLKDRFFAISNERSQPECEPAA